jgi:hypothetical protein
MATDNDTHSSLSAILRPDHGGHVLRFVLVPLSDRRHSDWHSYELHMMTSTGEQWSLVSSDLHTLFLDKRYDPEVPRICAGLGSAADTGVAFQFTPVDERDFVLEATPSAGGIVLRVQFDHRPAPTHFGWPQGVLVGKESLQRFTESLGIAFSHLVG